MTLIGTPRAASIVGTIPVGVVLPKEPKVSVCDDAFSSSKDLIPMLERTYIIELTAPGLPIQLNFARSNKTPCRWMPSSSERRSLRPS